MNPTREYEVHRIDGTLFAPRLFADLPLQFKALSWLYGSGEFVNRSNTSLARMFLTSLAQQRAERVYSAR